MSAAGSPCNESDDDRFTCNDASADPLTVTRIRDEFSRWLRGGTGVDEHRACDVVLAVNEALSNSAEFAYTDGGDGTVDVDAVHDVVRHTLSVTVSDRGHWQETNPLHRQRCRGRGIPLMRTLADSVIIDTSGLGTSVRLRFDDVADPIALGPGAC
jgi:anti-sigma regulatory factor (Ser/Thr protein kinase)